MARPRPRLIAITDLDRFGYEGTIDAFSRLCRAATPGSVCVQLRAELSAVALLGLGRRLADICAESAQEFCVNERLDVALTLRASAAHLKAGSVAGSLARDLWTARGAEVWLTRAWHPSDDFLPNDVDGLLVSPAFIARKGRQPLGKEGLAAAVARAGHVPVYALGGVDAHNVESVVAAGAWGVAAIGACYDNAEPLLRELDIVRGN